MDDTERFNLTWDKAYASGYHSGYMDAISELWELNQEAFAAGDFATANKIADISSDIRARYKAVRERNEQLLAEAAARNS